MEFSKQEYWSGLLFSSPRDLPDPGIESSWRIAGRIFTDWATRKDKPMRAKKIASISTVILKSFFMPREYFYFGGTNPLPLECIIWLEI